MLLHIDDVEVEGVKTARAVFDGYTDKKDADFIEERRVRTAETRQDTRSAILNVLSESRLVDGKFSTQKYCTSGDQVQ